MDKIINLTPHAISVALVDSEEIVTVYQPSGVVARCAVSNEVAETVNNIPVSITKFGDITDLPEPEEGTIYLVSTPTAQAAKRKDVVAPNTGKDAIRNAAGQIIAVRGFQRFV